MSAPIFVAEKVLEEAKSIEFTEPEEKEGEDGESGDKPIEEDAEDIKQWLENLRPDDFLKFEN